MKKKRLQFIRVAYFALFFLLLNMAKSTNAQIQSILLSESFDDYTVGNKIAYEALAAGHDYWTTWSNAPGGSEDGIVYDYDENKCGHYVFGNDQVLLLGGYETGAYDLEFDILLPDGKNGFFNILHDFSGSGSTWALQVYLGAIHDGNSITNSYGHGSIHAGSSNTADLPCVYDEWMHFRIRIDTDNDIASFFYSSEITYHEEQNLCQWQWSLDSYGNNNVGRKLDAMNFYPPQSASNSEFYLDNIILTNISGDTSPELTVTPNSINALLGKNETEAIDITIENNGNSIGEWIGWVDFGEGMNGYHLANLKNHNGQFGQYLGSSTACTREMGVRLPASSYYGSALGMKITSAQYYVGSMYQSSDQNYTFRLYGQGFNNQPGDLLAEKTISYANTGTSSWITATFDEPVYLTGQTIWATVELSQAAGDYPMVMDNGEYGEEQDGNWLSTNGSIFYHSYSEFFGGSWMITVNCQGTKIPGGWACLEKSIGAIMAGSSDTTSLTLRSNYMSPGEQSANIIIKTNDENNSNIQIPINLTIDYDIEDDALDFTTYDVQSNFGIITRTIVWPDGKVSFAYTHASDANFADRGTAIGTYDAANGQWTPSGGRVENTYSGFGSIAKYGQNGIVVASNVSYQCGVFIIEDKDNIIPNANPVMSYLSNTYEPWWPNVMTSGVNRNIIHVVANGTYGSVPGAENVTRPVLYYRSTDGGHTWDKQNIILPFMGPNYCTNWESNCCHWMETTDDNCLALVVNNPWSDGMVLYSYDNGETWNRKVFYQHPNPFGDFSTTANILFYPRWASCQWDSNHKLHVLYEYGGRITNSYFPQFGGVAYWNEDMLYNENGNTQSSIPGNLTPGQPFVLDSAYLHNDIHRSSWWNTANASHEMWPEYIGYLPSLDDNGNCENPYSTTGPFNIEDRGRHGSYCQNGVCSFPILCIDHDSNTIVAVWSALDENHTDETGKYYYKLFARASFDGGITWSEMKHLTKENRFDYNEFIYNQAAIVGNKLVIASQTDYATGSFVLGNDGDPYDCYYQGLAFNIEELFSSSSHRITAYSNPIGGGQISGIGMYENDSICTLTAIPNEDYAFVNWTEDDEVVCSDPEYTFTVTSDRELVANFRYIRHTVSVEVNPANGGTVTASGENVSPISLVYDFENHSFNGWTQIDADGDGRGWSLGSSVWSSTQGHDGSSDMAVSASYDNNAGPLTPDNYLVSPQISLGGHITFYACAQDASYAAEHFGVAVSTNSNTDPSDFTTIQEWTMTRGRGETHSEATRSGNRTQGAWYEYTVDLSAYSGMGYVAIRHFGCTDMWYLNIDDISLFSDNQYYYLEGQMCTLTAIPNEGFRFVNWSNDGIVLSDSLSYSFMVTDDAIITATFTENVLSDTTIYADLCQGHDYLLNGFEIIQPEVGESEYSITLPSAQGTDSIVNLTLTVYPSYYFVEDTTLCNATSFEWHGNTYTESGIYFDSLQTIHGCDSVFQLSLEMFNTPLGEFTSMTPTNNYPFSSLPITFTWDAVSGAEYYDLYIWDANDPAPEVPISGNIYNRSYYAPSLQNHQTYNWYVEAVNTCFSSTSSVRSFTLNIPPTMHASTGSLNFGEVALNNSHTLTLYVSGNALDDAITLQITGEDASMFSFEQGSNWNGLTGGSLTVTFSPTAVQYNYTANLVITTGTLTQTVQLTGSLADMFVFNTYVTQDVFEMNSTIPIYGTVTDVNNNPMAGAEVEVKVEVMGTTRSLFATTGDDGHFSVEFVPANSESGYYTVNSGRVGHNNTAVHDDFNIPGMNLVTNGWILWDVVQNETTTGSIVIRNRSQIPLTNIQVTATTLPEGCAFTFQPLSLQGMEEGVLEYSVTGSALTSGNNYEEVRLLAISAEGATMNFSAWYYCTEPRGILYAAPNNITTTMTKGISKIVDVMLYNNGTGPTGSVYLDIPSVDWLSVVGNETLPSIAVHDSAYFSLRLSANENTSLVQYTGNIAINCERGDGLSLPYVITAVSDSTGTLVVDVTDDYTYNGNGQHLAGATVIVKGYYSLQTVAIGLTGSDGTFTVEDIPEGYYKMSITAPRHAEYQATIQIEGGQTNTQNIYQQYQAITYSWNVVPTEIEDEYTFELVVDYETNVPVPVVVIDMPQTFPELAEGESYVFNYIITNYGLVDTYDATLYPPIGHPLYDFTPLITEIDTLHAQSSVVIPCTMTVRTGQRSPLVYAALNGRGERDDDCPDYVKTEVQGYYYCRGEKIPTTYYCWRQVGTHPCSTPPSSGGNSGPGGHSGGGSGGGGSHYSGSGGSSTPPVTTQQQGCNEDPCQTNAMDELNSCPPQSDNTPKLPPVQPGNNR